MAIYGYGSNSFLDSWKFGRTQLNKMCLYALTSQFTFTGTKQSEPDKAPVHKVSTMFWHN